METLHEEYVVDQSGEKKAVVLSMKEWRQIMEELEELDDIREYDRVKKLKSDPVPLSDALSQLK